MKPEQILRLLASEDFLSATHQVERYCNAVDTSQLSELQVASEFLNEALVTAKSLRAHYSGQAKQLAVAGKFLTPRPIANNLDLFG